MGRSEVMNVMLLFVALGIVYIFIGIGLAANDMISMPVGEISGNVLRLVMWPLALVEGSFAVVVG